MRLRAIALVVVLAIPAAAQAPWKHPRTPWGDPDIQGIWPGNFGVAGAMMVALVERQCCAASEVCAASHAVTAKLRAVSVVDASVVTLKKSHQRS